MYNDLLAVATLGPLDQESENKRKESQLLITRYYFSQFWCEFTSDVLQDFIKDDNNYKQE